MSRTTESLREHTQHLRPVSTRERVFLQNQQGQHPNKWDRSGVVLEGKGQDLYTVKVYGSGRLSLRYRRFLRAYTPPRPCIGTPTTPCIGHQDSLVTQKPSSPDPDTLVFSIVESLQHPCSKIKLKHRAELFTKALKKVASGPERDEGSKWFSEVSDKENESVNREASSLQMYQHARHPNRLAETRVLTSKTFKFWETIWSTFFILNN
ncbi:hypothetical protein AWC38_SpisGene24780 [Stylophora pistillata]|uniref:Uncharacterized protein n=1 Tax=Stylophora pistillata TaxID=50429 RepID=A0A2B4R5H0_STYPI|nr:hypothetical protein AWC38_SpisGene24780 [Stylophora pistillata]